MKRLLVLLMLPFFLVACKKDNDKSNPVNQTRAECEAKGGELVLNREIRKYECKLPVIQKDLATFEQWCIDESGSVEMGGPFRTIIVCDWDKGNRKDYEYNDYLSNDKLPAKKPHLKKNLETFKRWCHKQGGNLESGTSSPHEIVCDWDDGREDFYYKNYNK